MTSNGLKTVCKLLGGSEWLLGLGALFFWVSFFCFVTAGRGGYICRGFSRRYFYAVIIKVNIDFQNDLYFSYLTEIVLVLLSIMTFFFSFCERLFDFRFIPWLQINIILNLLRTCSTEIRPESFFRTQTARFTKLSRIRCRFPAYTTMARLHGVKYVRYFISYCRSVYIIIINLPSAIKKTYYNVFSDWKKKERQGKKGEFSHSYTRKSSVEIVRWNVTNFLIIKFSRMPGSFSDRSFMYCIIVVLERKTNLKDDLLRRFVEHPCILYT